MATSVVQFVDHFVLRVGVVTKLVRSMDRADRSVSPRRPHQLATGTIAMGKEKSMLYSPAAVPRQQRSNQDDERDGYYNIGSRTGQETMQCSTSAFAPPHEAATFSSDATTLGCSKSVIVLRRCEDLNIRTGGFQKIEEAAYRLDIRRPRQQQYVLTGNPGDRSAAERDRSQEISQL